MCVILLPSTKANKELIELGLPNAFKQRNLSKPDLLLVGHLLDLIIIVVLVSFDILINKCRVNQSIDELID